MRPFDRLRLDTERLHLRPLAAGDAAALFAIYGDATVMRYWSTGAWTRLAQAEAMIATDTVELAAGEHLRLGIVRRADSALIGTVSLYRFNPQCRRAEIGYALAAAHWGHG